MALSKQFTLPATVALTGEFGSVSRGSDSVDVNAYVKVETIEGSKELITATVSLRDGDLAFYKKYAFGPVLDGDNFIKQAYLHLKTLPEFADAVDC